VPVELPAELAQPDNITTAISMTAAGSFAIDDFAAHSLTSIFIPVFA